MLHLANIYKIYGSPLEFDEKSLVTSSFSPHLTYLRNNALKITNHENNKIEDIGNLSKTEILLEYANELILFTGNQFISVELQNEIATCLIDVGFFYQNAGLEMLQRAYDTPTDNDSSWTTSGSYLKKGLGILEFLKIIIPNFMNPRLFERLSEMIVEFKLIQQLGILILSLTKLKKKLSNDASSELDLHSNDLKKASAASTFYAKLAIGCHETCIQLKKGRLVNSGLTDYLEGLTYLLLSMDQYRKDECGVAIGMLEQCINSFSKIVPRSKLTTTILSTPKLKVKPLNKISHSFKSTVLKTKQKSERTLNIEDSKRKLIPVLNDTLDNFLIPLISLLNYVYNHNNDKLYFQSVIRDENELKRLKPQGKSPQLESIPWYINNGKIEEYKENATSSTNDLF
ncbi:hypothetical protein MOSE0_M02300 [Monosporozyma servazzii]